MAVEAVSVRALMAVEAVGDGAVGKRVLAEQLGAASEREAARRATVGVRQRIMARFRESFDMDARLCIGRITTNVVNVVNGDKGQKGGP